MSEEEQQEEHSCDDNAIYYEFTEDGHRYHGYECGICGKLLQTGQENSMSDDDVKQQALEQAQQAYGLFIWFVKWFSYVMIWFHFKNSQNKITAGLIATATIIAEYM